MPVLIEPQDFGPWLSGEAGTELLRPAWTNSQPMPMVTVDRATISPGDAVPHGADPAEFLDVDMDEFARFLALIAPDRFGRFQGTELIQPEPTQDTADGSW
jgi:hypothetical protein